MYQNLAILGAFIFLYSISSGRLQRTPINGAVVFTAFGLAFGPLGLNILTMDIDSELLGHLAEITLAMILFTDAANANLGVLKRNFLIPQRLLLIGLPLTILLGFGVGYIFFGDKIGLLEIAILATMLAPTDAALGKMVVMDPSVPSKIREGLNVESGLNDGICVPILFLFLSLAVGAGSEESPGVLALTLLTEEIGIGVAVGVGLAFAGAWLIKHVHRKGWITETWRQLPVVSLAVLCFALAQYLGGSGFIASFVGGLVFGAISKYKHTLLLAAEGTGDTFALITWVIFGNAVICPAIAYFSWHVILYALLSLTLIRILPVFLSLKGIKLQTDEKLFIGWFGPRGLATVVFAVIVFNKDLPGKGTIVITAVWTVVLSIFAHGISANPLVAGLCKRRKASKATVVSDGRDQK